MWYHLQSPSGVLLTFVLLHFVWQALLVYCLGRMGTLWLPLGTAEARYRWALGTLAVMLLCPLVTFALLDERALPTSATTHLVADTIVPFSTVADLSLAGSTESAPADFETGFSSWLLLSVQPYLMLGWIGGVLILALRLSLGYGGTVWLRRVGLTPVEPQLRFRFVQISDGLKLSLVPGIAFSRQVSEAMTVGLLRPMVLLPAAWLTQLTPEILEAVLAHELAHIRRRDLWVNVLQRIAETLFFYHPAIWWISSEIRRERELCCDELAIEATGKRLAYAQSLEQVARWQEERAPLLAAPLLGDRQDLLLGRVQRILGLGAPDAPHRFGPACLLLISSGIALAVAAMTILPAVSAQAQSNAPLSDSAALPPQPETHTTAAEAAPSAVAEKTKLPENEVVLLESILDLQEEVRLLQRQVEQLQHIPPHRPPHHGPPPRRPPLREGHRPPLHPDREPPDHHRGPPRFPPPRVGAW